MDAVCALGNSGIAVCCKYCGDDLSFGPMPAHTEDLESEIAWSLLESNCAGEVDTATRR